MTSGHEVRRGNAGGSRAEGDKKEKENGTTVIA